MRLLLHDQYMPAWFGRRGSFMLLARLPVLGGAAAILAVAWLLGACLLRWGRVDNSLERLERIVFALGAGLNAISLYVLAVGLAGGLHQQWAFFVPVGLLFPLAAWTFWRSSGMQSQPTELPNPDLRRDRKNDWLNPHWMWLAAPFVLAILLGGMLPPVEFDVREYHLEAPKEFYLLGRI